MFITLSSAVDLLVGFLFMRRISTVLFNYRCWTSEQVIWQLLSLSFFLKTGCICYVISALQYFCNGWIYCCLQTAPLQWVPLHLWFKTASVILPKYHSCNNNVFALSVPFKLALFRKILWLLGTVCGVLSLVTFSAFKFLVDGFDGSCCLLGENPHLSLS